MHKQLQAQTTNPQKPIVPIMSFLISPVGSNRLKAPFVSIGPGAMATNRIPYRPHSAAKLFVNAFTPAFAAADGTTNALRARTSRRQDDGHEMRQQNKRKHGEQITETNQYTTMRCVRRGPSHAYTYTDKHRCVHTRTNSHTPA
jgi:hypothetical protein